MKTPKIQWGVFEDRDGNLRLVSPRFRLKRQALDHMRVRSLENARVVKIPTVGAR
jgi:hypothetical protein